MDTWIEYGSTRISEGLKEALLSMHIHQRLDGLWQLDFPQLDRSVYEEFKVLLPLVRGFWNRKDHVCEYDPSDLFYEIVNKGVLPKSNPGAFFPTPKQTVIDLLNYIDFPSRELSNDYVYKVLEPSAGTGNIADEVKAINVNAAIDCFEYDLVNQNVLKAKGHNIIGRDFMKEDVNEKYDFVLMNPPFKGTEYIDHIMKAFNTLRDGGVLGSILPDSFITASTTKVKNFRNFIAEYGSWEKIGSPFETTKVKCAQIKLTKLTEADLERLWSKQNGCDSWFHYIAEIEIANDREFYSFLERNYERRDNENFFEIVATELDRTVDRLLRNGLDICWNDKVRTQVTNSLVYDIRHYY